MPQLPAIPLPTLEMVAMAVLFFTAGSLVPSYYAQERMQGFGRAMADRLPYTPPPGLSEEEALRLAAASAAEEQDGEDEAGG